MESGKLKVKSGKIVNSFTRSLINSLNINQYMKKNYNQPQTEVMVMQSSNLMLSVSLNGGGGGGVASAPAKRGVE